LRVGVSSSFSSGSPYTFFNNSIFAAIDFPLQHATQVQAETLVCHEVCQNSQPMSSLPALSTMGDREGSAFLEKLEIYTSGKQ
jgi:hypothetical protein